MSTKWQGLALRNGGRIQAGVPSANAVIGFNDARGLLLRGVVTATYLIDDTSHPERRETAEPVAVYCDVLVYSSMSTQRFTFLPKVLVSQETGGIHRGRVWKPRAATLAKTEGDVSPDHLTNPGELDGDHVLVGFMDDNLNQPVILKGLPHPSVDVGNEEKPAGNRLRLIDGDGDPDFWRHHGSFYGIGDDGSFIADTRFANDGKLNGNGTEAAAPDDDDPKGAQRFELPLGAEFSITLSSMADQDEPVEKVRFTITKEKTTIEYVETGLKMVIDGSGNLIELGAEGATDKAVLDSLTQGEFSRVKADLDNMANELAKHRHPVPEFPFPLLFADILETFAQPLVYLPLAAGAPKNIRTQSDATPNGAPMDRDAGTGQYIPGLSPGASDLFSGGSDPGPTNSDTVTIRS